ncbi:UDP-glucose 4-epimerase GalE [Arenibaculum pallidiluteum]|uniref:UDP-glucose 4-epimerase GalE n=1 Tax=Arenibaculum pallidiluteum TaxID=2812559 RepID=UPI001A96E82B|nr:UDP-glucose 4-epimerase GalE [Arenibaculum pallidiluteum]
MTDTVLVTGGAGYIGSHCVLALRDAGYGVVVVDDLSTGRRASVPADVPLVVGNVGDGRLMEATLREHRAVAALHFAGSIVVPESVAQPLKYYRNNPANSQTLMDACRRAGVANFIFSSTAAVYGQPDTIPLDEDTPTRPINPYGWSKLMTEWMLRDYAAAYGLRYAVLRYFNVAGADPAGRTGQSFPGATHLLKLACQTALGQRPRLSIFGTDYPTADGTCIRDYIHVSDLAQAHVDALRHLLGGGGSLTANCGYGRGFSVREVVRAVEKVTGAELPVEFAERRLGDPAALVSSPGRIRAVLGWTPRHDDLEYIVRTALDWERKLAGEQGRSAA